MINYTIGQEEMERERLPDLQNVKCTPCDPQKIYNQVEEECFRERNWILIK